MSFYTFYLKGAIVMVSAYMNNCIEADWIPAQKWSLNAGFVYLLDKAL